MTESQQSQPKVTYKEGDWVTVKKSYRRGHNMYTRTFEVQSYDEEMGVVGYKLLNWIETIGIAYVRPARKWEIILAPLYQL